MPFLQDWVSRFRRKTRSKPRQSVLTFDKYEELTATQALRFKELQATARPDQRIKLPALPEQPWYSLEDACERLGVSMFDLLRAAAENRIHCFVYAKNAEGYWDAAAATPVPSTVPDFLVLPPELCNEIMNKDRAEAKVLLYHHSARDVLRYRLSSPELINVDLLYLQHPLPDPDTLSG